MQGLVLQSLAPSHRACGRITPLALTWPLLLVAPGSIDTGRMRAPAAPNRAKQVPSGRSESEPAVVSNRRFRFCPASALKRHAQLLLGTTSPPPKKIPLAREPKPRRNTTRNRQPRFAKRTLLEEAHATQHLLLMWQMIVRHPDAFYPARGLFSHQIINSLSKLALATNRFGDGRL